MHRKLTTRSALHATIPVTLEDSFTLPREVPALARRLELRARLLSVPAGLALGDSPRVLGHIPIFGKIADSTPPARHVQAIGSSTHNARCVFATPRGNHGKDFSITPSHCQTLVLRDSGVLTPYSLSGWSLNPPCVSQGLAADCPVAHLLRAVALAVSDHAVALCTHWASQQFTQFNVDLRVDPQNPPDRLGDLQRAAHLLLALPDDAADHAPDVKSQD